MDKEMQAIETLNAALDAARQLTPEQRLGYLAFLQGSLDGFLKVDLKLSNREVCLHLTKWMQESFPIA